MPPVPTAPGLPSPVPSEDDAKHSRQWPRKARVEPEHDREGLNSGKELSDSLRGWGWGRRVAALSPPHHTMDELQTLKDTKANLTGGNPKGKYKRFFSKTILGVG